MAGQCYLGHRSDEWQPYDLKAARDSVLVVSPHWQTVGVRVSGVARPETIHDFGGFPARFIRSGTSRQARRNLPLTSSRCSPTWACLPRSTHSAAWINGAWVPLRYLRPAAHIPVLQVSLTRDMGVEGALELGQALAPLRDRGVLIIGSGSLTHNLYEFRCHIRDPEYAQEFADLVAAAIARRDDQSLVDYRTRAPHAARAHPTEEHYLPLLVAVGASRPDEPRIRIPGG